MLQINTVSIISLKMILKILIFITVIVGVVTTPVKDDNDDNGYMVGCVKCHPVDKSKLNVHLIAHSHDDVGWLKTADQYYYGLNMAIHQAGVQYIMTSVFEALKENKERRFIQVETEFFWRWWNHQDENTKKEYKSLVDNGQIEMVNGAWSMNDEACTNYQSTIDQFTWGLATILQALGTCAIPRIGWQIDPFGHSREQVSLLSQMGYDAVMFARLDYNDKQQRQSKAALDFAWQGSANLDNSVLFASAFPTSLYFPPAGFCWDYRCLDDTIDDDPDSPSYNIKLKVEAFTNLINEYKLYYPTNNVLIPMGGDFQYEAASKNFINMDRFIKGFKNHTELNVIYSTPSCYVKAVYDALDTELILKTDDFFPYAESNHSYWTGYYTSRPNSKRFERMSNNVLQATKQLYAHSTVLTKQDHRSNLRLLRESMGVMQHHDAITGTEKQHVATDYVRRLQRGIKFAEKNIGTVFDELLHNDLKLELTSCLLSNISICAVSQNSEQFVVAIYNPLAWKVTHYVRLPVENAGYQINDGELYDLIPTISDFSYVDLDEGKPSTHELLFAAKDIPPMGIKLYYVKKIPGETSRIKSEAFESSTFEIDTDTNLLKSVNLNGINLNITQNFYFYYSETGESDQTVSSGAYVFRPNSSVPEDTLASVEIIYTLNGQIVDEVQQKWITNEAEILQTIRWYKGEKYLEFDWIVGNISNDDDSQGKEFISKFTIEDFDNKNIFYTDSNGRELLKRTKDQRVDYTYDPTIEPVSSNYYPVTSRIVIRDVNKNIEVGVLTDRSQGGSSLAENELELMVHRRILHDDNKGVNEWLSEVEFGRGVYVRGSHYLVIGKVDEANPDGKSTASQERILAQKKLVQPWIGLSEIDLSYDNFTKTSNLMYEGLRDSLPENVNVLTFAPWSDGQFLLRLEHIMEKNDDSILSNTVSVDITNAFKHFYIESMTEHTLSANLPLSDYQKRDKYQWKTNGSSSSETIYSNVQDGTVTLAPMQIRTFVVTLKESSNSDGFAMKPVMALICSIVIFLWVF